MCTQFKLDFACISPFSRTLRLLYMYSCNDVISAICYIGQFHGIQPEHRSIHREGKVSFVVYSPHFRLLKSSLVNLQ